MTKPHNIASFMLRFTQELWQDTAGDAHVRWRGHIKHVQDDAEQRFTDFAEAVSFMQRHLMQLTEETLNGADGMNQEKIFEESFKMWEQFANSYAKMMSQAMEQSLRQSETFREQMDEAGRKMLDAWRTPFQPDAEPGGAVPAELLQTIADLQTQVQALAEKVGRLENQRNKPSQED